MKSQDKRGITSKKIQVMHPIILKGFVFIIHTIYTINLAQSGTVVVNCPDIAFLDNSTRITCSTSVNFTYIIYTCPCGPVPHCAPSFCTSISGYNASIVSRAQTELTILSAQPRHAGNWSCSEGEDEGYSVCNLILTKIPSVTITSDVDADSMNLDDRITLTVDIGGYYCSGAYSLTLQVGSVNYNLGSGRNNTYRKLTETIPINVTQTHFGDVKLDFACGNHLWNITPEGLHQPQQNIPKTTTCDITSDKDTETLTLHEEVTLTVNITTYHDIRGSYCSTDSDFTLQTGDVTHLLNVGDHGLQAVTINVTKTHLGGVRLVFNCQDKLLSNIVSCDGVTKLYNKIKATAEPNTVSTPILIAGVIGAVLFLSVVINIACAVKRKVSESAVHLPMNGTVAQTENNVVVGSDTPTSVNNQRAVGLGINPIYIPTDVCDSMGLSNSIVIRGTSTETGGDHVHTEARGEYVALDRIDVQPSNIYEHLRLYEQIANM